MQVNENDLVQPPEVDARNRISVPNGLASILNTKPDPDRTSAKYSTTDDLKAVKTLNNSGWFINNYKQVGAHNREKSQFRTYLATYTHESGLEIPGEGKLTVLQKGSHDGSKKLVLNLGFFRAICANGMVAGESLFKPLEIKHIGDRPQELEGLIARLLGMAPTLFDKIRDFQSISLSEGQALGLAHEALALRFGDESPITPEAVLVPLRNEDSSSTLWKVMNRIQERLIKKTNLIGTYKKPLLDSAKQPITELSGQPKLVSFQRAVSGVKGIDLDLKINTGLWDIADRYLKDLTPRLH